MAKCLVTGGAGFVGSNLVDELIRQGDKVVIIDDLSTGKKEYINLKAKFYKLDICSNKIGEVFKKEKFAYVFHLAAQIDVRKSVAEPIFDNQVNVIGSINIYKSCLEAGIKRIIFISTGGAIYGDVISPAREDAPPRPDSPYALHKYAAEKHLEFFSKISKLHYSILRPANIYGPRQYKGGEGAVIATFIYNALHDASSNINGDGYQTRDFVYVSDVVRAMILAAESKTEGIFNIGIGLKVNLFDIIKAIELATNKRFRYKFREAKPGEVRNSALSYEKAKKILGWEPKIKLEEGIKRTVAWSKLV